RHWGDYKCASGIRHAVQRGDKLGGMAASIENHIASIERRRSENTSWVTIGLLSLGAAALGPALLGKVRLYEERSLWWLGAGVVLAILGALLSGVRLGGKRVAVGMMAVGLAVSFWVLLTERPGSWGDAQWVWFGSVQDQKVPPLSREGLLFDEAK